MNTIDLVHSLAVVKWDIEPLWSVKTKDIDYVMAFGFGILTMGMGLKRGLSHIK